jgi:hypothetical protein
LKYDEAMVIYHKTPTDESFFAWLSQYPDSFSTLDLKRFYCFVRTACKFNSKTYLNPETLHSKIKLIKPSLSEKDIEHYLGLLRTLLEFYHSPTLQSFELCDNKNAGFEQITFIEDKKYVSSISKYEYLHRGISRKEVLIRAGETAKEIKDK